MPQKQTVYEVTAPDGKILEVTGPEGASNEEVIAQAQRLYKPSATPATKASPQPLGPPAPPNPPVPYGTGNVGMDIGSFRGAPVSAEKLKEKPWLANRQPSAPATPPQLRLQPPPPPSTQMMGPGELAVDTMGKLRDRWGEAAAAAARGTIDTLTLGAGKDPSGGVSRTGQAHPVGTVVDAAKGMLGAVDAGVMGALQVPKAVLDFEMAHRGYPLKTPEQAQAEYVKRTGDFVPAIPGIMGFKGGIEGIANLGGGTFGAPAPRPPVPLSPARIESIRSIWPKGLEIRPGLTNASGALLPGESPSGFVGAKPVQFLRDAATRLGLDPAQIARSGGIEALNLGVPKYIHDQIRKGVGKEAMGPIAKELADEAVRISDEPIRQTVTKFSGQNIAQAQAEMVSRLRAAAAKERNSLNDGKAKTLDKYADSIEATDGTVEAIDRIKIDGNEKIGDAKKNPTAQARADQSPLAAHEDATAIIREVMYPELEKLAGISDGRLIRAGVEEHSTMQLRDAIYEGYDSLAGAGRPNRVLQFGKEAIQGVMSPRQSLIRNAFKQSASAPQTMAQFNKALQKTLRGLDADAPIPPIEFRPSPVTRQPFTAPQPPGFLDQLGAARPTQPGIEGAQTAGLQRPVPPGPLSDIGRARPVAPQPLGSVVPPQGFLSDLTAARPRNPEFLQQLGGSQQPKPLTNEVIPVPDPNFMWNIQEPVRQLGPGKPVGDNFVFSSPSQKGPVPEHLQATVTPTGANPEFYAALNSPQMRGLFKKMEQSMTPTQFQWNYKLLIERLKQKYGILSPEDATATPMPEGPLIIPGDVPTPPTRR